MNSLLKPNVILYDAPYNIEITEEGDWIDLRANEDIDIEFKEGENFKYHLIDLGISMLLPVGFEAIVAPRSSCYKHYGFIFTNSIGIIDNTYVGYNDRWKIPALFINTGKKCTIRKGDRVAQFKLQLSMKSSITDKKKWVEALPFEFKNIRNEKNFENLKETWTTIPNRNGIGSTGKK